LSRIHDFTARVGGIFSASCPQEMLPRAQPQSGIVGQEFGWDAAFAFGHLFHWWPRQSKLRKKKNGDSPQ
jgi:hypothetical protein